MSTPTELENLLSEALTARAEQVGPTDLRPGFAPHVRQPWWLRLRLVLVGGGVLVAAAVAVVLIAVSGDDGTDQPRRIDPAPPGPTSTPTGAPTSAPTSPPTDDREEPNAPLPDLLPEDQVAFSADGETVTYDDGSSATVTGSRIDITTAAGDAVTGTLPIEAEGGVAPFRLQLGQAGSGYLVSQSGGEIARWSVVLDDGTVLTSRDGADPATFGTEVSGDSIAYLTWSTGQGSAFYTRVDADLRLPKGDAYAVYAWEVTGPGEGGGADAQPRLVATDLGLACLDADAGTFQRCGT